MHLIVILAVFYLQFVSEVESFEFFSDTKLIVCAKESITNL